LIKHFCDVKIIATFNPHNNHQTTRIMSDENKDLGDKAEDAFDSAKESAKEFSEDAKKAASDFTAGAKEAFSGAGGENKKVLAGILAIIIGSLGIHKFILGYTKEGIIQIVISFITCGIGGIVPLIEGIIYLTKSDEEFYNTYQVGRKPWF